MGKIRRMFPGGNTANGFCSFHDNIMGPDRNKLYVLKGMPGGGKSSLMREIGRRSRINRWNSHRRIKHWNSRWNCPAYNRSSISWID